MKLQQKIVFFLALVCLLGTVTNYIYLSPLLTLLLPLCIFVVNKKQLPQPIFWLYVFAAMFLLSTLIYDWHSFFVFSYYRRDGNFIISYAPLLILPLFSLEVNLKKYIRYFYLFTIFLYTVLFLYHFLVPNSFMNIHGLVFKGLFHAHNAAGGFFAVVASLGVAYFYNRRNKKELLFFVIIFIVMVDTHSRGAVLGFSLALVAWYCSITKRYKLLIGAVSIPILLTVVCLLFGYPYFKSVISTQSRVEKNVGSGISSKNANVFIRVFYTFPRAWYLFLHSPIVGTGVGSYDDRPLKLKKVMPLVSYNAQPNKSHTNRTAHHSYLNILAEQGIMGLGVFLVFWVSLYWYLMQIRGDPIMRDFLLLAYFSNTFVAFTGHRITTPSNMLPFVIILGLFMAQKKTIKLYRIEPVKDD